LITEDKDLSVESRKGTAQRIRSIKLIAKFGVFVSLAYVTLYTLMGSRSSMLYNSGFLLCYGLVASIKAVARMPIAGILLIGCMNLQLAGTGALFVSPNTGVHFYLILLPIFGLIAMHPKERYW